MFTIKINYVENFLLVKVYILLRLSLVLLSGINVYLSYNIVSVGPSVMRTNLIVAVLSVMMLCYVGDP